VRHQGEPFEPVLGGYSARMTKMTAHRRFNWLTAGLTAGAAGTTALNAVTYLDMAARGRPTSSSPQMMAEKLTHKAGLEIPGDDETRQNRLAGLGPLSGLGVGLGVGVAAGLALRLGLARNVVVTGVLAGAAAMASTDVPMAVVGVSDPRSWSATDWLSDVVPHLVYGVATAAVVHSFDHD